MQSYPVSSSQVKNIGGNGWKMTRIVWSSPAVICIVTAIVCSFMMGLAVAPWIDKLRHLDKKKARDGGNRNPSAHEKIHL